jgi:hypothetical protein
MRGCKDDDEAESSRYRVGHIMRRQNGKEGRGLVTS